MDSRGITISPRIIKEYIERGINRAFQSEGITASMGQFILEIDRNPGISLKSLSSKLSVDKSLTTRTVKTLIGKGIAEDRDTGRCYSLHLTEYGIIISNRLESESKRILRHLFSDVTDEEREIFHRIMDKVRNRIEGGE